MSIITSDPGVASTGRGRIAVLLGSRHRLATAGAVCSAALTLAFTLLYWNRFLSPSAGSTFFYVAEQILKGRLPYRDFFFVVPPLHALKIAALIHFFGDRIAVVRLEAMVERSILAALLFFWLSRFARPSSAMFAAFFTCVQFAADDADPLLSYHHDSVLWAVAAGLCASFCIDKAEHAWAGTAAAAAGMFCAFSLLTKQTTGAGVLLALVGILGIVRWRDSGWRRTARLLALLFSGWLLPIGVFVIWLWRESALRPFLQTILTASSSKGTLRDVLARPVLQLPWVFVPVAVFTVLLALGMPRSQAGRREQSAGPILTFALLSGVVVLAIAIMAGEHSRFTLLQIIGGLLGAVFSLTATTWVFLRYGWRYFRQGLGDEQRQIWLMSGVSFAVSYMLSLSFAAYSPMVAPGLAMIVALALDRLRAKGGRSFAMFVVLLLVLTYSAGSGKLERPFIWMDWTEPVVTEATSKPQLAKLAGLRISDPTLSLTETITKLVREHTRPGDSLVVYPYLPIFYVLTDLNPATYAFNYYLDVCPDAVCREDASRMLRNPPDAIIFMVEDDASVKRDEATFRGGRESGSRAVVAAILTLRGGYRKLLSAPVPGGLRTIEVYSRR